MSYYEKNSEVLSRVRPELNDILMGHQPEIMIYIGDASLEGIFLAMEADGQLIAMQSTYSPKHEAERYLSQFELEDKPLRIILYGFGTGEVIRGLMAKPGLCEECIIFEPSIDLFYAVMEHYDISDILEQPKVSIFVGSMDITNYKKELYDHMGLHNYQSYRYVVLPRYADLFAAQEVEAYENYEWVVDYIESNCRTQVMMAEAMTYNSIFAFRYIAHSKNIYGMRNCMPEDLPCIIIGAGPSLRRNVQELKKAKGRCFMICVDTAAKYCLSQGVVPDVICTIDSLFGTDWTVDEDMKRVPLLLYTSSNIDFLKKFDQPEAVYMSVDSKLHHRVLQEFDCQFPNMKSVGSVGTGAFEFAVQYGFRTIIFVGQDLSIANNTIYAGEKDMPESMVGKDRITDYSNHMVDGYYGDQVCSIGDYYAYLEWYSYWIAKLTGQVVINSTEGGAKIPGTIQMPLSEAISTYCVVEYDFETEYKKADYIVQTEEELRWYQELLADYGQKLCRLRDQIRVMTEHSAFLQQIIDEVQDGEFQDLFRRYMFQAIMDYQRTSNIQAYLRALRETADYLVTNWQSMLQSIGGNVGETS